MAAKPCDYTGQKFGKLTAIENTFTKLKDRRTFVWNLRCDCGNLVKRDISILKQHLAAHESACSECNAKNVIEKSTTHGDSKSRLYSIHRGMMRRCYEESNTSYSDYGAKGIFVENYLQDYQNFKEYVTSIGGYSSSMTLDRINPKLNYERGNIRWATVETQARNKGYNKKDGLPLGVIKRGMKGHIHYRAIWTDLQGKRQEKSFSARLLGEELALFLAQSMRDTSIERLNLLGAGYSEYHGKQGDQ